MRDKTQQVVNHIKRNQTSQPFPVAEKKKKSYRFASITCFPISSTLDYKNPQKFETRPCVIFPSTQNQRDIRTTSIRLVQLSEAESYSKTIKKTKMQLV